jgi:hypothetical protein
MGMGIEERHTYLIGLGGKGEGVKPLPSLPREVTVLI